MYLSSQVIASDGDQTLTIPTLAGGAAADAKCCLIEVRSTGGGGAFSYRWGAAVTAGTYHALGPTQPLWLYGMQMDLFHIIRDTSGQGTAYVTYFSKVPDIANRDWLG